MKRRYAMGSFLAGAAAARAGDEMSGPALLLAGYAVGGSATEASALLAGITVSAAVGGPLLGALLDRSPRPGRLLARALALYGTGLVLILLSLGRLPLQLTVLIAVFTGLLGPALSGGWTAQLPRVVPRERMPRANALDAMTFSLASLVGPALAGVPRASPRSTGRRGGVGGADRLCPACGVDAADGRGRGPSPRPGQGPADRPRAPDRRPRRRNPRHHPHPTTGPGHPRLGRLLHGPGHADHLQPVAR
ncbi:MFS transporter [Streptomyces sp. GLT-R25]